MTSHMHGIKREERECCGMRTELARKEVSSFFINARQKSQRKMFLARTFIM